MRKYEIVAVLSAIALTLLGPACGQDSSTGPNDEAGDPEVDPSMFVSGVDNPYFPLTPGATVLYEGESDGEQERVEVEVTGQTKKVLGVTCVVVRDRVWVDGELVEDTLDWFAQHRNGDVWYFGEDSKEIEDGEVVSTEGSWEAGVDGARPGILIKASPVVGESYQQEYYEGEAEDMARVLALGVEVEVPAGSFEGCLQTREWTPLEPGVAEHKYYAPGVGFVREVVVEGGEGHLDLVEIRTR